MIKNYFKTLFRNLTRQKVPAVINILGLSAGIACFSLFMLYAINEFNYDNFHKNGNIYRVFLWHEANGSEPSHGDTYQPMPLGPAMKQDLPDVEDYVRFREATNESFIKVNNKVVREKVAFADPSFFSVFSFKLIHGSPVTALKDLRGIVLTEAAAENLFGKTNPLGITIEIKTEDKFEQFTIAAIAANPPGNSSIQFKILGNFNYLTTTPSAPGRINNWRRYSYQTYVQLKPGSHLPSDKSTLVSFRKKYYPDEEAKSRKDGWMGKGPRSYFGLQPVPAIHTDTRISGGAVVPVEAKTIWILLGIAAGILIIACINFTTLAIGRSAGRSKEVGVRKVIGGSKISLIKQFLFEAFLLASISAVIGILLAKMLLPYFNKLSGRDLDFSITQFPQLIWLLIGVVVLTGLLAGSYPALVLSAFKPVEVLKTKLRLGGSNIFTRSLVTLQFVLSIGLIISTIVILQQLRYMQGKHPGFNKENVLVIEADGIPDTKNLYALFKHKLTGHPEIIGSASADLGLGGDQEWSYAMFRYNGSDKKVYEYFIDPDYLQVLGMKLLTGRNFNAEIGADTVTSVIINEAMMNNFGWTFQNAVGQKVKGYLDEENDPNTPVVIGVVENFHYRSFGEQVQPQMFQQFAYHKPHKFFVRIRPANASKALAILQAEWKNVVSDYPFKYSFLDEDLDRFYESETRWSSIIGWASGISIFLACLGLFGLAALAAVNRTKEIGIRKVLGASLATIVGLLSKDFFRLVVIALLIASPLAWYFMNKWLQNYAYQIRIGWWVFVATGAATMIIAVGVISLQTIKAAIANPIKSLRTE